MSKVLGKSDYIVKQKFLLPPTTITLLSLVVQLITASESSRFANIEEAGFHEISRILSLN